MRKVYSECSLFRGVFRENISKIPVKYEKCTASLREFHPIFDSILRNFQENLTQFLKKFHSVLKKISRNFKENYT